MYQNRAIETHPPSEMSVVTLSVVVSHSSHGELPDEMTGKVMYSSIVFSS